MGETVSLRMFIGHDGKRPKHFVEPQKKLRREILFGGVFDVVDGDRFDAGEDDVFGDFDAEAAHTGNENVGFGHASHRLLAKNVQLARVESLVNFVGLHTVTIDGGTVDCRWRGHV